MCPICINTRVHVTLTEKSKKQSYTNISVIHPQKLKEKAPDNTTPSNAQILEAPYP